MSVDIYVWLLHPHHRKPSKMGEKTPASFWLPEVAICQVLRDDCKQWIRPRWKFSAVVWAVVVSKRRKRNWCRLCEDKTRSGDTQMIFPEEHDNDSKLRTAWFLSSPNGPIWNRDSFRKGKSSLWLRCWVGGTTRGRSVYVAFWHKQNDFATRTVCETGMFRGESVICDRWCSTIFEQTSESAQNDGKWQLCSLTTKSIKLAIKFLFTTCKY